MKKNDRLLFNFESSALKIFLYMFLRRSNILRQVYRLLKPLAALANCILIKWKALVVAHDIRTYEALMI